jgi:hypothetical protein
MFISITIFLVSFLSYVSSVSSKIDELACFCFYVRSCWRLYKECRVPSASQPRRRLNLTILCSSEEKGVPFDTYLPPFLKFVIILTKLRMFMHIRIVINLFLINWGNRMKVGIYFMQVLYFEHTHTHTQNCCILKLIGIYSSHKQTIGQSSVLYCKLKEINCTLYFLTFRTEF